ncbi:hypothetical protein Aduo_007101 [Ancylostoma duodenale]
MRSLLVVILAVAIVACSALEEIEHEPRSLRAKRQWGWGMPFYRPWLPWRPWGFGFRPWGYYYRPWWGYGMGWARPWYGFGPWRQ